MLFTLGRATNKHTNTDPWHTNLWDLMTPDPWRHCDLWSHLPYDVISMTWDKLWKIYLDITCYISHSKFIQREMSPWNTEATVVSRFLNSLIGGFVIYFNQLLVPVRQHPPISAKLCTFLALVREWRSWVESVCIRRERWSTTMEYYAKFKVNL